MCGSGPPSDAGGGASTFRCAIVREPQLLARGQRRRLTVRLLGSAQLKLGVCSLERGFDPTRSSDGHASASPHGWAYYAHNGQLRHNSNASGKALGKPGAPGDIITIELDARAGTVCFLHNGRALGDPHGMPAAGGAAWPLSAVAAHGAPGSHAIEREPAAVEPDAISPAGVAFTGVPADVVFCVEIKEGGCQILSYC